MIYLSHAKRKRPSILTTLLPLPSRRRSRLSSLMAAEFFRPSPHMPPVHIPHFSLSWSSFWQIVSFFGYTFIIKYQSIHYIIKKLFIEKLKKILSEEICERASCPIFFEKLFQFQLKLKKQSYKIVS
jgi:hypothetical protein